MAVSSHSEKSLLKRFLLYLEFSFFSLCVSFKAHAHTSILAGSVLEPALELSDSSTDLCTVSYKTGTFKSAIPTSDVSNRGV